MLPTHKLKQLALNTGFRKYFFNTSWMFGEKILRMAVAVAVGSQVARFLGVENFGILNYSISLLTIFTAVTTLGLDEIIIHRLVQRQMNEDAVLGTAFSMKLLASAIVVAGIILFSLLQSKDATTSLYVSIIAVGLLFQPLTIIDIYFQSRVQSRYLVFASLVSLIIISAIRIYFIIIKAPLVYFALAVVLEAATLGIALLIFYLYKKGNPFAWKFDRHIAGDMLKAALPLAFSGIIISLFMKVDQIIIKEKLDLTSVGHYAAAAKVSELWYFIPMAISGSLFPAIINAKKTDETIYMKRLQQLFDLMVLLSVTIAIGVTFMADWLITLLYGADFISAADILVIHIWTGVFVFLGVANSKFTVIENLTKNALIRTIIGVVLNICLNLIMIPAFGIKGAAIAILISQFVTSYLSCAFWSENRPAFYLASKSLNIFGLVMRNYRQYLKS